MTQRYPSWVGFDEMFNELAKLSTMDQKIQNWPPYNIKRVDENHYAIEMAVAGFAKSDLNIIMEGNKLTISGKVEPDNSVEYIHKGIADRAFQRSFTLADNIVIQNADLVNGYLKLFLEKFVPDHQKPKKIDIGDGLNTVKSDKQLLTE